MARALSKVVVFDQTMYHGNGVVHRWMETITHKFEAEAIRAAPIRSGRLKAGIHATVRTVGEREIEGLIESRSTHTMFVLRGTGSSLGKGKRGLILPTNGPLLRIRAGYGHGKWVGPYVHGQQPNNFLVKAWRATARNHTSIRGVTVPAFIRKP